MDKSDLYSVQLCIRRVGHLSGDLTVLESMNHPEIIPRTPWDLGFPNVLSHPRHRQSCTRHAHPNQKEIGVGGSLRASSSRAWIHGSPLTPESWACPSGCPCCLPGNVGPGLGPLCSPSPHAASDLGSYQVPQPPGPELPGACPPAFRRSPQQQGQHLHPQVTGAGRRPNQLLIAHPATPGKSTAFLLPWFGLCPKGSLIPKALRHREESPPAKKPGGCQAHHPQLQHRQPPRDCRLDWRVPESPHGEKSHSQ